ncbi:ATPase [Marinicauda pacifica]|uniref:ATPase n=1 Tax=Marinicauda pacifica TaxID=1133559 RepID=A0A4S2H7L3_9PROT|nr:ATP12 family protein [Marinicauda pacifica]TGY91653.1 hypothetical protein E5162_13590 [Marinicauda pacifica]GGE51602.1 ATPase [Marinicauda pacifica]
MSMSKAKAENRPLPKRFYSEVAIDPVDEGWRILLDGRPVKTPARAILLAPGEALAAAMATEWRAQEIEINPFSMPLTRLAHVALDRMDQVRDGAADEIARFAGTDMLCYRSDLPDLARRQAETWDPYLDWAARELDAPLHKAQTILPIEQPEASIETLRAHALTLDNWRLTGLASAVPLTGSAVLGFALLKGRITGEAAFETAQLEQDYQAETWGEDSEAADMAANRRRDLLAADHLFQLMDAAKT